MKKIRLAYLIFGTFLLLYLFLYNPKQSLINFQSYISNFDAEKTSRQNKSFKRLFNG